MAEQESGRTELPTPHKREDARKKGMVVHSADVGSFAVLVGFVLALVASGAAVVTLLLRAFNFSLGAGLMAPPSQALSFVGQALVLVMVMPLLCIALFALIGAMIQHPPVFSAEPLKPDWKKLNPVQGLKRFFSLKTLFLLGMALLKVLLLSVLAWLTFKHFMPRMAEAVGHPAALWPLLHSMAWAVIGVLLTVFGLFAIIDYAVNRRLHTRDLMMSPREIRDEVKRREGDPLIKRRIREYRLEMLKKIKALGGVADADMVIVNPTHYSVAIKYNPQQIDAPVVVAKGGGALALRIRLLARRHKVPVFQRRKLARALFFSTDLGQPVPQSTYREIAILLRQARQARHKV